MRRALASLRGGRMAVAILVAAGLVLVLGRLAANAYTEILWHAETGYLGVFWTRVLATWGARMVGGGAVAALVFLNLKVVAATLAGIQIKRRFGNLEISEQLPSSYVAWTLAGASVLLGLWFGAAVPSSLGIQALALANAGPWGIEDPFLGRDVGFYVFWVPLLGSLVTFALVGVFLLFTLATAGYAATGALRWGRGRVAAVPRARMHLGLLLGAFFVLLGVRLWLSRYLLLLDGTSDVQGIFGFTDAEARLPGLQTLVVICAAAGALIVWSAWKNLGGPLVGAAVTTVVAALVIGQLYPALVQRFQVEPNELARESRFIEQNLTFTRIGFGLDAMRRLDFMHAATDAVDGEAALRQIGGLPVWSRTALATTFRQLEAGFRYYDFPDVSVDRYDTPEGPVTVALSVRELDPSGIQDPNWQNLHLRERYVAGMGLVAVAASRRTSEARPSTLLSGIPPAAAGGGADLPALALDRPRIFYGNRSQPHAVVNPGPEQFLAPDGSPGQPGVDFPAGIRLSSPLRTAALAWRFRDANLLFAREVHAESRFVFRRRVVDRARAVAPFLRFPEAPYPVVHEGRVVWILEGFTATRAFPLSSPHELRLLRPVTYARNSVKVTVDAVTGEMDFYRVPIRDPLADAYAGAFPGLVKPIEEMPRGLREHLRYPEALLELQSNVLLQYHQDTAPAFHGQQDVWARPNELFQGSVPIPHQPEYGLWRLPGEEEPRFHLTAVFVPAGRQNLTAFLVGRTDVAGTPELHLYDVPVADQVPGPRQVESLVEQDPVIAQQFSLWRTGGSEVWTGHLHLVPVGRRLLYMEPVYLAAEADAIPELRRFVLSDGVRVVMGEDLAGTLAALVGSPLPVGGGQERPGPGLEAWPAAALEVLDRAEERLRAGDWQGFGRALEELRALLRRLGTSGTPPDVDPPPVGG